MYGRVVMACSLREQDSYKAFLSAIKKVGLTELKKSEMFGSNEQQQLSGVLKAAA
ncbi:hypothetical protein [Sulfitobacter pontiacus]|jgi:hypothetical protein|uniref:hypothetical protein n=1 Tax=Sulfitobacter pontiacus TaxID=60137 RepID=UPI00241D8557|nr:hypothetical protein [Sulfitobacter pontiacus]